MIDLKKRICFLVGSMGISGGTYVIVQHAAYLRDAGFDITLAVQESFTDETLVWHDEASKLRCIPFEQGKLERYDLVIATWWKTALGLPSFNAEHYAYFVQSIESRFYPETEKPLRELVDATYRLPVAFITEATWIQTYLKDFFNQEADLARNGVRKDIYRLSGPTIMPREFGQPPRVLVEGHFGVPFKNTALGVRLAREAGAKDIWVLTGSPVQWLPGVSRVFSQIPMTKTAEIYRSCDILIKLSTVEGMFGPPLEMFHCGGTAIVFDVSGHDEYIADRKNARVIPNRNVDLVVSALRDLLDNRSLLTQLQRGALDTAAAWPSWQQSSQIFAEWIEVTLAGYPVNRKICSAIIAGAYSTYEQNEKLRLAEKGTTLMSRYKLRALASKLPSTLVRTLKKLEAPIEVIAARRVVY